MRKVLNDPELQKQFDRDGYVRVPFISGEDIAQLKQAFFDTLPQSGGTIMPEDVSTANVPEITYDFTFIDKNVEYKKQVFDIITGKFAAGVKKYLGDYKPIIANFIRKKSDAGEVPLHQNWAFVEEKRCTSVSIWCPLVDSTIENGTLQVVPGSHKRFGEYRGPMVPWELENLRSEIIANYLQPLETKAGDAIILDDSIIHYSAVNKTNNLRLAIQLILIPSEVNSVHYYLDHQKPSELKVWEVDKDFYMEFNPWKIPEGRKVLRTIPFNYKALDAEGFKKTLENERFDTPSSPVVLDEKVKNSDTISMKPIFKDPETQAFFDKNGFVKIPMLGEEAVKELLDYFYTQKLVDHTGYGFNMSMEDDDKEKATRIRDKIYEVALPQVLPYFDKAKVIAASYVVKEKNPQGVVPPHQDWSFADKEGQYYSVTCWIPLVETNMKNGYMGAIKGSHKFFDSVRPSPSPQVPTPLAKHLFSIFPYLEMYEMKPGEALIFDHRTFHASTPNVTDSARVAIGLGFTQADARVCHYNLKQNGKKDTLQKYYIDDNFLKRYDNTTLSKMYDRGEAITGYEVAEELPYVWPDLETDKLVEMIKEAGNTFNIELCEHMARLFNFSMDGSKKPETPTVEPQTDNPPQVEVSVADQNSAQPETTGASLAEQNMDYSKTNNEVSANPSYSTAQVAESGKTEQHEWVAQTTWIDNRSFFQKYTPVNIIKEIKDRLSRN